MKYIVLILAVLVPGCAYSQESELMLKYRRMALEYSPDIKSARENVAASIEMIGAAKADLKPKLGAGATYQYAGHPIELNIEAEALGTPLHFQGQNNKYGASLSLSQPLYSGGRLLALLEKAGYQRDYALNEALLLRNVISRQSDVTYWNSVARGELVGVAEESKKAVGDLVKIVKLRVDLGYTDPSDLLMAEVKLNEAEYALQQSQTVFATSVMSLNSLIGVELDKQTALDSEVKAITTSDWISALSPNSRPEYLMAQNQISISESDKKITNSKYLPQLSVGADGSFQSPSYDFTPQMKPNYGVYATLSVPLFEWGKKGKESRAAQNKINRATQQLKKVEDHVNLEVSSARLALVQAVEQVNLTHHSLSKAFENEKRSTERYAEGRLSIMEVLQAQLYRQNAQVNYIEAKLIAQSSWSELQRALSLYNVETENAIFD